MELFGGVADRGRVGLVVAAIGWAGVTTGWAQTPAPDAEPPARGWEGTVGAGVSLTSGNSDTINYNLSFDFHREPEARNVWSATGLFLRGEQDGELNANRTAFNVRDQVNFDGAFMFGRFEYLRDTFKEIDYLLAPTIGAGYSIFRSAPFELAVDGGIGGVWEKNPGMDVDASGALTASEKLTYRLSDTATLKHSLSALWKMRDFEDSLYTLSLGLATAITTRTQFSIELLDTFKNRPPSRGTQRNDVALVTAITFKY